MRRLIKPSGTGCPVKLLGIFFLAACLWQSAQPSWAVEASSLPVSMKWLGNAGFEIRVGTSVILIDPFFTRKAASAAEEWKTNEEEVLRHITKADFIFVGHSHADHLADVPFIAKRFASKIVGSRTTINIALTAGIPHERLTTISGGEKLKFDDFSVEIIESQHGVLKRSGRRRLPKSEEVLKPWSGPIKGDAFVEGGSYLYYFSFGDLRVLHQSTGNFIEEHLKPLRPDIALLADNSNYDWPNALRLLQPKTVVIHHYDQWRAPLAEGIPEANRRRALRFEKLIKSFNNGIRVIIPEHLQPISLE